MINLHEPVKPDVPNVLLEKASSIEQYLLEQVSIARQQTERIIEALHEMKDQATAVEVRIADLEAKAVETAAIVGTVKKAKAWIFGVCAVFIPALYVIFERLADKLLNKVF